MATYFDETNFVNRYKSRFNLDIDKDWSERQARLHILQKFLNGSIYDNLQGFYQEYTSTSNNSTYVPLVKRRPSVIYNLPKIIVDASVAMLFGEGHFPVARCDEENTTQFLQYINRVCDLKGTMIDAARKGSVGSAVVLIKVLEGRFYFEALHSIHCIPVFNRTRPRELQSLTEKKKVEGATLRSLGYQIKDEDNKKQFFIMREWTETEEIYYNPYQVDEEQNENFQPSIDKDRSTVHDLEFVPAIWIKNLPKSGGMDGHCTFEDILDICIEIDYQLSQHGRLLRYSSDPTLVIKNPTSLEGQMLVKGQGALNLDEKGEAYLLQITDGATKSVMDYIKCLREFALELVRGNRASPDKIHSAQSGEALKMLNFELVSLVEEMRITYGEYGLLKIYQMVLIIANSGKVDLDYDEFMPKPSIGCENHILLDWPAWYPMSALDKSNEANTLAVLTQSQIISKKTAIESIADEYNISEVDEEMKQIDSEKPEEPEVVNDQTKMYDKKATKVKKSVDRKPASVERKQD